MNNVNHSSQSMPSKYFLFIILFCFFTNDSLWAQFPDTPPNQDSMEVDSSKIEILHIGTFKEKTTTEGVYRELIGDVHLKQKKMHLWCDLGFLFPLKVIKAYDNVQMLQDDSIRIFSDSLFYDGITRLSQLRKNVVLKDTSMTLFTDILDYDLNTRIATFPEGSIIESDTTTLVSKRGTYSTITNMAHFEDSVRITNPNYKLTADSLEFNTKTEKAFFLGPTKVYNDEKMVYCEDGFYNSQENYAELYKNARFENKENGKNEVATSDTIIYDGTADVYYLIGNAHYLNDDQEVFADTILMDGKTDQYEFLGTPRFKSRDSTQNQAIDAKFSTYDAISKTMIFRGAVQVEQEGQIITSDSLDYSTETKNGLARGNVVFQDSAANMTITCGQAYYNDSTKFLLAHDEPLLMTLIDNDTMWLRADTLISIPDSSDINKRNLKAYYGVQVFKSNLQALCDSLFYNDVDSIFHFYKSPILWVDGTQFTAEIIDLQMKNSQMHRVLLYENSFIVNTTEATYFNQVKGENVVTKFVDGDISTMAVDKKGKTVYYAVDDNDLYMGVNDVACEDMLMYFSDNQVKRIRFEGKPAAVLYPMHQVDHNSLKLDGFQWLDSLQIKTKYQFFGIPGPVVVIDSNLIINSTLDSLSSDELQIDSDSSKAESEEIKNNPEISSEKEIDAPADNSKSKNNKVKKVKRKRKKKKKATNE